MQCANKVMTTGNKRILDRQTDRQFSLITIITVYNDIMYTVFLIIGVLQKHKWEDAMTVDKQSWGYRRNTTLSDFLTMDNLTSILASVVR